MAGRNSPLIDTGLRFGTAGFFPIVAKAGTSLVSSRDRTASSRLPSEIEKLSRAAAIDASLVRRSVTISQSATGGGREENKTHAKLRVN